MSTENLENTSLYETLDSLLSSVKLDDVSSENSGRTELPDGYYLSELESAELTLSKTSRSPQVNLRLRVVEDGIDPVVDEKEEISLNTIKAKNRKIFMSYPLTDERSVKRFVSDMLKFEGEPGESLLGKEYFTTSEVLEDALDILVGMRIYVQISTFTNKNGEESKWRNLVSWKRISELGLN